MKKVFLICVLIMVSACCSAQEAVDLGLSVKWSTINVGAKNPREYGNYYAWGELSSKESYTQENYKIPPRNEYEKYQAARDISGTKSDVARYRWQNYWRIPTVDEFRELLACKWELKNDEGGYYYIVTGPSGKSIILPLQRYMKGKEKYPYNECYYWTSNSFWDAHYEASALLVIYRDLYNRNVKPRIDALHYYYGAFIRPVQPYWKNEARFSKRAEPVQSKEEQDAKYVESLKKEAAGGMSQSSFQAKIKLAKMYLEGDRVEMNLSEALNIYLDLAINDNLKDAKDVLCYYKHEILSNKTYVQKLAKTKVASNLTQPDGWDLLCMDAAALTGDKELVLKQLAISKEYNNGLYFHWLEPAAILFNDSQAMYELSELLLDNTSKLFDSKKGIELLKKAADMGNPDARHSLGLKYKYGLYVEKDKKKAKEYLK